MKDFLFDIGRVLLDLDFETSMKTILPPDTKDPDAALIHLFSKRDDLEAGLISAEEYTQWGLAAVGSTATPEEFHHAWRNIFALNNPMWERVRQLKAAGHRLILFSNTNGIHFPWLFEKYPEFDIFDGAIFSYEVGSIKPQPEIYHHAIEKYGMIPQETIYIDDLSANIETGNQLGFKTHQYDIKNHGGFEDWLETQLT